ncbi:MAG: ANTAR domain-containing protein [Janthinobacterium lividum]
MARAAAADRPQEPSRRSSEDTARGSLSADFLEAVGQQMGDGPLTAGALARAGAQLLPVDAVGISTVAGPLRLPLGGSTAAAEEAEELQTTLGDGPCLAAAQSKAPCAADLGDLLRRWPLYGEELTRRTPYRSVASVPLPTPDGEIFAALDLYSEDPRLSGRLDLGLVAAELAAPMGALLDLCLRPVRNATSEAVLPEWYVDATARRLDVSVAMGMVMALHHQPSAAALSLLRGYAYSHDRDLDDVAEDIVLGRLDVQHLVD